MLGLYRGVIGVLYGFNGLRMEEGVVELGFVWVCKWLNGLIGLFLGGSGWRRQCFGS